MAVVLLMAFILANIVVTIVIARSGRDELKEKSRKGKEKRRRDKELRKIEREEKDARRKRKEEKQN